MLQVPQVQVVEKVIECLGARTALVPWERANVQRHSKAVIAGLATFVLQMTLLKCILVQVFFFTVVDFVGTLDF